MTTPTPSRTAGHHYRNRGTGTMVEDDSCITCGKALGETLDHFPDSLVDAGHVWSCSIYCEACYQSDGDCGAEHPCQSGEHYIP